jgi:hypothetical protein
MKGFNLQPSTGKTCANCAMSKNHLANGLICLYTDKPARDGEKCGLYLPKRKDEDAEENQGELF